MIALKIQEKQDDQDNKFPRIDDHDTLEEYNAAVDSYLREQEERQKSWACEEVEQNNPLSLSEPDPQDYKTLEEYHLALDQWIIADDSFNKTEKVTQNKPISLSEPAREAVLSREPFGALREIIQAVQDESQAHFDICAHTLLALTSLAAQSHISILHPNAGKKPISLFLLAITESSERKSMADGLLFDPISTRAKEWDLFYDDEYKAYQVKKRKWDADALTLRSLGKAKKESNKTTEDDWEALGAEPEEPLTTALVLNDMTPEGLMKALCLGQPSAGIFSTEGGQFLAGRAMNEDNRLTTAIILSSLWDNQFYSKRLASDRKHRILHHKRLSLNLMLQPQVGDAVFKDPQVKSQGLWSRCLIVSPPNLRGERPYQDQCANNRLIIEKFCQKMLTLLRRDYVMQPNSRNDLDTIPIALSPEAKALFVKEYNRNNDLMKKGSFLHEAFELAGKKMEHAQRLGTILAAAEDFEGLLQSRTLSQDYLARGVQLMDDYLNIHISFQDQGVDSEDTINAKKVMNCILRKNPPKDEWIDEIITTKQLLDGARVRPKYKLDRALALLLDHEHLERLPQDTFVNGKKCKEAYKVNSWYRYNRTIL